MLSKRTSPWNRVLATYFTVVLIVQTAAVSKRSCKIFQKDNVRTNLKNNYCKHIQYQIVFPGTRQITNIIHYALSGGPNHISELVHNRQV